MTDIDQAILIVGELNSIVAEGKLIRARVNLRQEVESTLEFCRAVEVNVIGEVDAEQGRLHVLQAARDVRSVDEVGPVETDNEFSLRLTEVVLAECVDDDLRVVQDTLESPVLLQIVRELEVDISRVW